MAKLLETMPVTREHLTKAYKELGFEVNLDEFTLQGKRNPHVTCSGTCVLAQAALSTFTDCQSVSVVQYRITVYFGDGKESEFYYPTSNPEDTTFRDIIRNFDNSINRDEPAGAIKVYIETLLGLIPKEGVNINLYDMGYYNHE